METNKNQIQEPIGQSSEPLYDHAKAACMAETLRELLNPEYILLFGKLAGGTPHSDTFTYDLLAITDGPTHYDWYEAKRYLKMKLPQVGHGAPYVNIYVHTRHDAETIRTPFFHLARKEGIVLYSSHNQKFSRPKDGFDFGRAAALAERYADAFLPSADRLVDCAQRGVDREHIRESAFATAQAAIGYYRTLFYVYHGFEADTCDVRHLHHRLRTLSGELPLLFESDEFRPKKTLCCLNNFAVHAQHDPQFFVDKDEMAQHLSHVRRLGAVTRELCRKRMELYDSKR